MKTWIATTAALALLAGLSTANAAQNTPASTNDNATATMERSSAPKMKTSNHKPKKTKVHLAMRNRRGSPRETTGFGGRSGAIGSGRNDPSIHQSAGDRDSRDFPKRH